MDSAKTSKYVDDNFEESFVAPLSKFIEIPNLTPAFDDTFLTNDLTTQAIQHVIDYADSLEIEGLKHHWYKEEGRAPMLLFTYEGEGTQNVMLYGHLDKQPHMEGWMEGTGPTTPAIIGDKLYGRGASDDGYVPFAVLMGLKNVIDQGQKCPRVVLVLETEEESGSKDLVYLLDKNADIIKTPDICICLDSGALDYKNVWLTSTLRGMFACNLKVEVATQGTHSGLAGGIIPDTWRILTQLLKRVEDQETGVLIQDFNT